MHCQYCGSINGEDDHRCLRCGRRLAGFAIAAPALYIGATALAVSAETLASQNPEVAHAPATASKQTPLFHDLLQKGSLQKIDPLQKIIPFEQLQRHVAGRLAAPAVAPPAIQERLNDVSAAKPAPPRAPAKRQPVSASQGSLDFRPGSPQGERILATGVPAQVYGEGRVAPPMRRVTAGAMDVSMVVLGFGVFAGAARFGGSAFGSGKAAGITLALAMILISLFYGLLWSMARRETAGMNWTQLHLVTFDGSQLEGRDRAIRFISAWLSYCSGGLGLLWALADEENLTFHDHISKTYPAERGATRSFVRQRQ